MSSSASDGYRLVLSCEHAGNEVPPEYRALFDSDEARAVLASHRGWDPGSLEIGGALAEELGVPLVVQRVSRLVVECNRALGHPALYSEFSKGLDERSRSKLVDGVWRAHREEVAGRVEQAVAVGTAIHLGVHTFTPDWRGRKRATDIGLLYDPARAGEVALADRWRKGLLADARLAGLCVHRNRPYRGWTDGLVTTLRERWPPDRYVGLELEVSQRLVPLSSRRTEALAATLSAAVAYVAGR